MVTRAEIVPRRPNDARSIGCAPRLLPPPSRGQARSAPHNDRNGPVPTDGPDRCSRPSCHDPDARYGYDKQSQSGRGGLGMDYG